MNDSYVFLLPLAAYVAFGFAVLHIQLTGSSSHVKTDKNLVPIRIRSRRRETN